MSFIDVLCSELDIETEEEWRGNDGCKYKLKLNGEILKYHPIEGKWKIITGEDYANIVNGSVYPQWLQMGATYYIPALNEEDKYIQMEWLDCDKDRVNKLRGLVFKNKKDAITMTNKILGFIDEKRGDGEHRLKDAKQLKQEREKHEVEKKVKEICDYLNVYINDPWLASDGNIYIVNHEGEIGVLEYNDIILCNLYNWANWESVTNKTHKKIMDGTITKVLDLWVPQICEKYYLPDVRHYKMYKERVFDISSHARRETQKAELYHGLMCKTKEEAKTKAENMIRYCANQRILNHDWEVKETYYTPNIYYPNNMKNIWTNDELDIWIRENGLAFDTVAGANMAEMEMLKYCRESREY